MLPNLNYLIEQVGKDKGISKESIIETLEEAMLKAAQKKYGAEGEIEALYNEELGEVELFRFKEVVEEVSDERVEITLPEALDLDPEVMVGDQIGVKIDTAEFGRIAAQVAKQVIIQRVRSAERENIYNDYKDRKGDLIAGTVRRVERGNIIVDLGRTEGILLAKDQSPRENYRPHDRILAYVEDVTTSTKGPQIGLTRSSVSMLLKLFEMEVPEIAEGIVQVVAAAREPGNRSKIAVVSRDSDVDPVGACVGMKGTRVQNIVNELRGEKIDIVTYNADPVRYVCNSLAPAVVSQVLIDEDEQSMEVIVPDDMLSLAIGKRGQNVRLASQLTNWRLDIQSESKVEKMAENARVNFLRLEGVDEELSETLTRLGFLSLQDIYLAELDDLKIIPGLNLEKSEQLVLDARKLEEEIAEEVSEEEAVEKKAAEDGREKPIQQKSPAPPVDDDRPELLRLKNMDEELMERLKESGYYTISDLLEADMEAQDFAAKFDISLRKTRAILHSVKQVAVRMGLIQDDGESLSEDGDAAAEAEGGEISGEEALDEQDAELLEDTDTASELEAAGETMPEEAVAEIQTEDGDPDAAVGDEADAAETAEAAVDGEETEDILPAEDTVVGDEAETTELAETTEESGETEKEKDPEDEEQS